MLSTTGQLVHILFFADASSIHSYRWIKFFSETKGYKITWCSLTRNEMPELANAECVFLDIKTPLGVLRAIRYIVKQSPDIVHAHYLGWNGFLSLFFPKAKVVLTAWGSDIVLNRGSWLKKILLRVMLRRADKITCDAYHLRDQIIQLGGKEKSIDIIMFGIDEDMFVSKRKPFDNQESENRYTIGSTRYLEPIYDVITLLRAARIILAMREDVVFNVAGSGPDLDSLNAFVDENEIQHGVRFVGELDSSQLVEFYDGLDIYVSTSLSDGGIASSTAEAMLLERPAVITDAAENSHWVRDRVNGRLFDCRDFEGLAKILSSLLEDQNTAIELGKKGRDTIILRNSYRNEMLKMLGVYENISKKA